MNISSIVALGIAALLPAQQEAGSAALTAARKPLSVEPKYEGKPRYLLIAVGQPIHRAVWCVVDGKTLYVDRDGDGRLDAEKERFLPSVEKVENHFVAETHTYAIGDLPSVGESPAYPSLELSLSTWNLDYKAKGDLVEVMETLRANPSLRNPTVTLKRKGKPDQFAMTEFADAPAAATVLHFDAAETWGLVENLRGSRFPAGQEYDFEVSLGTPGIGDWSFVFTMSKERRELRPEIDVVFTTGEGKVTSTRWVLPEWC